MTRTLTERGSRGPGRGAALLEFVIVLPFLVFFLLFTFDVGRVLLLSSVIQDSTFTLARTAAQEGVFDQGRADALFSSQIAQLPGGAGAVAVEPIQGYTSSSGQDSGVFTVCSVVHKYVVVKVTSTIDSFVTPGLGTMLKVVTGSPWTLNTTAVARCEVARE